ncbi:hypothetical protein [Pontibacillus salipaludis]
MGLLSKAYKATRLKNDASAVKNGRGGERMKHRAAEKGIRKVVKRVFK